jgi:hypothetical protein
MGLRDRQPEQNPLDVLMRQTLQRSVPGRPSNPQARQRLMERVAARNLNRWLLQLLLPNEPLVSEGPLWLIGLSWREMAYAQAMRPMGWFGSMMQQIR